MLVSTQPSRNVLHRALLTLPRRLMRCCALLFGFTALLLAASPVLMQDSASADNILFVREADTRLDEEVVRAAMTPLAARGVRVAVYFVQTGSASDFLQRLRSDGLGTTSGAAPDVIALYAAVNDQYSEIRWGIYHDFALRDFNFRSDVMNPALRSGDYTRAFADTLAAIETTLAGGRPPVSRRSQTQTSSSPVSFEWIVFGIIMVGAILYNLYRLYLWLTGNLTPAHNAVSSDSYDNSTWRTTNTFWHGSSDSSSSWSSSSSDSGGSDGGSWSD